MHNFVKFVLKERKDTTSTESSHHPISAPLTKLLRDVRIDET